jgi:hypothetical protein
MKAAAIVLTAVFLVVLAATAGLVYSNDENAEKIFLDYCQTCHPPSWALQAVKSDENWRLTIERMSFQYKQFTGKEIPLVDQELILEYLQWETGK